MRKTKTALLIYGQARILVCLALLLLAVSGFIISRPSAAHACYGATYDYDDVVPVSVLDYTFYLKYGTRYNDDSLPYKEFLFLYPFTLVPENKEAVEPLWGATYNTGYDRHFGKGTLPSRVFPRPSMDEFKAALARNDYSAAEKEAKAVIDAILDMPPTSADNYQDELKRALEFIELIPFLDGLDPVDVSDIFAGTIPPERAAALPRPLLDVMAVRKMVRADAEKFIEDSPDNPRTPTLRFVAMQEKFKREIPDGWSDNIQVQVPESEWRELEALADNWLKDYPEHPLADLVRLWKNRVYYFERRDDLAWNNLLEIYPRRLARVLAEMRFLVYQSTLLRYADDDSRLPDGIADSVTDPVVLTALVTVVKITPERWTRWWKLSEENISEPWSVNLQERLLYEALELIYPGNLPEGYPDKPNNPTVFWAQLRAAGLMAAEDWNAAREQIFSIEPVDERAMLAATYYFNKGDYVAAVQVEGLNGYVGLYGDEEDSGGWPGIRSYIIRVLVDNEGLNKLQLSKDRAIREAAIYEEGVRLASAGRWVEAAKIIENTEPKQAALWREVGELSRDTSPSGYLKLARFFREHNGDFFYGIGIGWYRSLSARYSWMAENYLGENKDVGKPGEFQALEKHISASEMLFALQAYVKWLETAKPSPEMREVVKEADYCYNKLINASAADNHFWQIYLEGKKLNYVFEGGELLNIWKRLKPVHPLVVKLREAGRRSRGK